MEAHPDSRFREPPHTDGEDCRHPCGEHALVGGSYPKEFHYTCKWCGDDDNGQCRFAYYSQRPDCDVAACDLCGECDCKDGHHGEAILCQTVGECSGMWYDMVSDTIKGTMYCWNCFETGLWH